MKLKSAFTIMELLLVVIIAAVMAAAAMPGLKANMRKERAREAMAVLGAIRTQMRIIRGETGAYDIKPDGSKITPGKVIDKVPGFKSGDLAGIFFAERSYNLTTVNKASFTALASSSNPKVKGITVKIDQDGTITITGL